MDEEKQTAGTEQGNEPEIEPIDCNDGLCPSCFYCTFHKGGSFYAVAECGDDPYDYWYCAKYHWAGYDDWPEVTECQDYLFQA